MLHKERALGTTLGLAIARNPGRIREAGAYK